MQYNFSQLKEDLKNIETWLSKEYSGFHTGQASPMILDSVSVEAYGSYQPIKNTASISIEDAKTLRISPWDKSQVKAIEKAITSANLGLSVATDDLGLRVIFPMLTAERRVGLVKILKEKLEDARVSVRQEREKAWGEIQEEEKQGGVSEDEKFRAKDELQKYVDEANSSLDAIFAKKEKDVINN